MRLLELLVEGVKHLPQSALALGNLTNALIPACADGESAWSLVVCSPVEPKLLHSYTHARVAANGPVVATLLASDAPAPLVELLKKAQSPTVRKNTASVLARLAKNPKVV